MILGGDGSINVCEPTQDVHTIERIRKSVRLWLWDSR